MEMIGQHHASATAEEGALRTQWVGPRGTQTLRQRERFPHLLAVEPQLSPVVGIVPENRPQCHSL
jgi:hypothetical protein